MTRNRFALGVAFVVLAAVAANGAGPAVDTGLKMSAANAAISCQTSWDNADYDAGRKTAEAALAAYRGDIGTELQDLVRYHYWFTRELKSWKDYAAFYDTIAREGATPQGTRHVFKLLAALGSTRAGNKEAAPRTLSEADALAGPAPAPYAQAMRAMVAAMLAGSGAEVEKEYRSALVLWQRLGLPWECFWATNNIAVEVEKTGQGDAAAAIYLEALDYVLQIAQAVDTVRPLLGLSGIIAKSTPEQQTRLKQQISERVDRVLADKRPPLVRRAQVLMVFLDNATLLEAKRQALAAQELKSALTTMPQGRASAQGYTTLARFAENVLADPKAAEGFYRQALDTQRKVLGENHPDTIPTMKALAVLLYDKSDYAAAEPLFRQVLAIRKLTLGENHPETARATNVLAILLRDKGDYAAAEPLFRQALEVRTKVLGPDHPDTLLAISGLARLYYIKGAYAAAEPLFRQALAFSEKIHGPGHPDTASAISNLADTLLMEANYAAAEPLYRQELEITRKARGEVHAETASSINSLAVLLTMKGDYVAAEPLFREALEIKSKTLGDKDLSTANTMDGLANLLRYKGDYAAAEPLFRQALEIRKAALGEDALLTASSMNNLAILFSDRGDNAAAEPLYRQALEIYRKKLGEDHPDTARLTGSLAGLLSDKGDYAAAEPLFPQALAVFRKVLGEDHPQTADTLTNLAILLGDEKCDYAAAEPLLREALAIRRKAFGDNHPDTANAITNLARLLSDKGDYAAAEPLYRQALGILEKVLGETHPDTNTALINLAALYCLLGRDPSALESSALAMDRQARMSENVYAVSSERQRLAYHRKAINPLPVLVTVALRADTGSHDAASAACLWTLRRKGVVLDSMLEDQQLLAQNPAGRELSLRIRTKESEIGGLILNAAKDKTDTDRGSRRETIAKLEAETEKLAQQLAALSPRYAGGRRAAKVTIQEVQQALKPDEVLLEFLRVRPVATAAQEKQGLTGEKKGDLLAPVFVVFVVKGSGGAPTLIDLGGAEALERLETECSKDMRSRSQSAPMASLQALYGKLWQPLAEKVRGCRRVYLSPDGALNFIPFGALVGPDGQFLAESMELCYLASGRDLVRHFDDKQAGTSQLFGDPAFREKEPASPVPAQTVSAVTREVFRSELTVRDRAAVGQLRLPPLPGTRREVEDIRKLFDGEKRPVEMFLGVAANKSQLLAVSKPEVLHLATHGFFLPTADETEAPGLTVFQALMAAVHMSAGGEGEGQAFRGPPPDNPMRRCGLALTGAALAIAQKDGITPEDRVDGIVTGAEIGALDLWGTRLVVLSACDTGLGDLQAGEGVMGLRRAFVQAGAQNLVLTLWPIQDAFTAGIMTDFYREFLKSGDGVAALCQAQRNAITAARAKDKAVNPRAWAPFLISVAGSGSLRR